MAGSMTIGNQLRVVVTGLIIVVDDAKRKQIGLKRKQKRLKPKRVHSLVDPITTAAFGKS